MPNNYFRFKQFTIFQDACAMKVTTDACLFGAWCAQRLRALSNPDTTLLDIGAGTGLLSLMIRQQADVLIDAVEIDAAAATQAASNIATSPWPDVINIKTGDVTSIGNLKSYDAIVSNPPFYENELRGPDARRNTAHHNTNLSLDTLIPVIANWMKPEGIFFLLQPAPYRNKLLQTLAENGLFVHEIVSVQQTPAHAPFRIMVTGGREEKNVQESGLIIMDAAQLHTPAFIELLQPYYLKL